jgi:hypothetical protein
MKECLFCKKDFNPKKVHAKFCSDKCRVYYNRISPKKDLGLDWKKKIDLIFNKLIVCPEPEVKIEPINDLFNEFDIRSRQKIKDVSFFLKSGKELEFEYEFIEWKKEVENCKDLSERDRKQLLDALSNGTLRNN